MVLIITYEQIRLRDLKIFSAKQLSSLLGHNILTAETFIGICASSEGFSGVARILEVSGQDLNELLGQVKAVKFLYDI